MDFQVSSSSEYGRFEQIVSQFLLKALHIVLESRIPSFKPQDHSRDLLSNSKANKTDKWFNLALGDRPASLEKLHLWHRNLMDPMVIDIVVIRRGLDDSSGNDLYCEQMFDGGAVETVIERWVVQFGSQKMIPVQTSDISSLYKKMYRKSIILFRSLCSMMRHLPAYRIFRHLSSNQPSDINILYKVSSFGDPFSREEEQKMKQYSFNSVEAVNGRLRVSVTYRLNLSEFNLQNSTTFPPVIITDYVGNPAIYPMRAFPIVEKVSHQTSFSLRGTRDSCSTPSQRPHSWSSGIHFAAAHKQNYPLGGSPPPCLVLFSPNDDPSSPTYVRGQRVQNYRMLGGHHKTNSYDESFSPPFSPSSSPSPSPPAYLLRQSPNQSRLRPESAPVAIPYPMLNRSPRYTSPSLSDPNRQSLPPFSPKSTKPEPSVHGSPSGNRLSRKLDALRPGEVHSGMTNLSYGSKISRDSKDESGRFSGLLSSDSSPHKAFSRSSSRSFQDELDVCDFSCSFDVDDVDTSDSQASQSVEARKGLEFNAAFSLGRKSQDAAVGALVHMLRTAPPLRQDSSFYSTHSQSQRATRQAANFGTTSGFSLLRKASDALKELKSYREMKDMILSKSRNRVVNTKEVSSSSLPIGIARSNTRFAY